MPKKRKKKTSVDNNNSKKTRIACKIEWRFAQTSTARNDFNWLKKVYRTFNIERVKAKVRYSTVKSRCTEDREKEREEPNEKQNELKTTTDWITRTWSSNSIDIAFIECCANPWRCVHDKDDSDRREV